MERIQAESQAKALKIDITQVVREFWETFILKGLFETNAGKALIFKGGTALRLVYGSPRFSEDLDFSLSEDRLSGKLRGLVGKIIAPFDELALTDLAEKYFTYFAEIKVSPTYLPAPFRIKIEISKRLAKDYLFEPTLISSPVSIAQCLGNVATLEQLYEDKLACLRDREKPKDVFDFWYISQKLKKPYDLSKISIATKELRRDLRKYLPRDFWSAIDLLKP